MTVLVHIGYPKTATTWLQECVFGSQQTAYAPITKRYELIKTFIEPHELVFDTEGMAARFNRRADAARQRGDVPVLTHERLIGNPYSGGYDATLLAGRLRRCVPAPKIVMVIREQRDIIRSSYQQQAQDGGTLSLASFLNPPPGMQLPLFDLAFFEYDRFIQHYYAVFGADNVRVLLYEKLRADPGRTLEEIAAFCGYTDFVVGQLPLQARVRQSKTTLETAGLRHVHHLFGPRRRTNLHPLLTSVPLQKLGTRLVGLVAARLARQNERLSQQHRAMIAQAVQDRYVQSNRQTMRLTGHELAAFGYQV